jgi:transmembrane sensor
MTIEREPSPGTVQTAEEIEEAAATWLVRLDRESAPEEWARLDAWMAASPRHRAAFLRLSVAWRQLNDLRKLAPLGGEADMDLLDPARLNLMRTHSHVSARLETGRRPSESHLSHMSGVRAQHARSRESRPSFRLSARGSRMAASIAAVLVIGVAGAAGLHALRANGADTYSTNVGELRRITLDDGSLLTLNTDSLAEVSYSSGHRKVQLKRGEALFTVAHDASRPFDVTAGPLVVRAVGTQFSVRRRDESSIDVLLTQGQVALNTPSSSTMNAGTLAQLRGGHVTMTELSSSDISDAMGWTAITAPRMTFHGETLRSVVEDMNRYNARKIVVSDAALSERRIGGTYPALDPEGFATRVEHALGVHARRSDSGSVISLESQAQ